MFPHASTNTSVVLQELSFIEFFAGHGNLSKVMKLSGLRTTSLDLKYKVKEGVRSHGSNPMDLNSRSGFAFFRPCFQNLFGFAITPTSSVSRLGHQYERITPYKIEGALVC